MEDEGRRTEDEGRFFRLPSLVLRPPRQFRREGGRAGLVPGVALAGEVPEQVAARNALQSLVRSLAVVPQRVACDPRLVREGVHVVLRVRREEGAQSRDSDAEGVVAGDLV